MLPRMKAVDKIDVFALSSGNQPQQLFPLGVGIGVTPAQPVIRIILGRVKIRVHASLRAKVEEKPALGHRPRRTKKSFDNAATKKILVGYTHKQSVFSGLTRGNTTRHEPTDSTGFRSWPLDCLYKLHLKEV